jgi:hypothetical protein
LEQLLANTSNKLVCVYFFNSSNGIHLNFLHTLQQILRERGLDEQGVLVDCTKIDFDIKLAHPDVTYIPSVKIMRDGKPLAIVEEMLYQFIANRMAQLVAPAPPKRSSSLTTLSGEDTVD